MLTYENSPENFAVAILKALVHPGSKSCKCAFCERQPFRKDEMRAAVSPKTQRYLWTWVAVLYVYWKENIYLSMSRNAQIYDVNFISNKLLNINVVCTVETLHYFFFNFMLAFQSLQREHCIFKTSGLLLSWYFI